jgi:hypothetical protein
VNLGWISEAFELENAKKTKTVMGWQFVEVVRMITTQIERSVKFEALESNKETVALAWGGATITSGTGGAYTIDLPDAFANSEFIIGIDWFDGTRRSAFHQARRSEDAPQGEVQPPGFGLVPV